VEASRELVDRTSEQLGVYLHTFAAVSEPRDFPGLEHGLARLLAKPQAEDLAVLRQFLSGSGPLAERGRDRIVAELRRRGDARWIRACGALEGAWVVREFPCEFFDFVERLDLTRPEQAEELLDLCARIGSERLAEGVEALGRDRRLLAPSFTSWVFADRSGTLLPFAWRVLATGGESYKESFLAALDPARLDPFDRELLEVVRRPAWLSTEYLLLVTGASQSTQLGYQRQAVLCRYLRASDGERAAVEERVRAVRLLRELPSVQVLRQLKRLVSERRLGLLPTHPKALRQAAREVIRYFEHSPLEWNDV
jgi:hypothetical protein